MIYCRRRGNWSSWNETSAGEVVRKEKWVSMYVCVGGCLESGIFSGKDSNIRKILQAFV